MKVVVWSAAPTFGAVPYLLSGLSVSAGEGRSLGKYCGSDFIGLICTAMESLHCFPGTLLQTFNWCNLWFLESGGDLYELQFAFLSGAHPFAGSHDHGDEVPGMDLSVPNQVGSGCINNPFLTEKEVRKIKWFLLFNAYRIKHCWKRQLSWCWWRVHRCSKVWSFSILSLLLVRPQPS